LFYLLGALFLEQATDGGGAEVERRVFVPASSSLGGMVQRSLGDGHSVMVAQDGGVVWRRGDIDGRPGKVNALISWRWVRGRRRTRFYGVCNGVR
jgi:hypothetical protein